MSRLRPSESPETRLESERSPLMKGERNRGMAKKSYTLGHAEEGRSTSQAVSETAISGPRGGTGPTRTLSSLDRGAVVSFHDINYTVQVKPPKSCCATVPKQVINSVSGIFKPGLNAILGATGSGKTSLLDILAARKDPSGLQGQVLIDGSQQPDNFKCMSGYVVQDDVVMGTLTVRENFQFSANLRLPKSVSKEEKERRVNEIINELGLNHVADTKVGTEFIRGISGGERKRTNIGMELIISPTVLFLDEPTTGLDASTANAVMMLLHRLGRKGKTIIFSIHQPRYSIFKLFDQLLLLSKGHTVYHGSASDALQYFDSLGYICEEHNNPPDFFLDVINGDSTAVQAASRKDKLTDSGEEEDYQMNGDVPRSNARNGPTVIGLENQESYDTKQDAHIDDSKLALELASNFVQSPWCKSLVKEIDPIYKGYVQKKADGTEVSVKSGQYATSFFKQLRVVSGRTILNIIRNPQTSFMQIFIMIFFALIVGTIYFQLDISVKSGIQNRVGAFFFIVMNQIFGNLSAVELFIKERKIFIHENSNGFYRVSAYFVAKIFCDLIPMRAVPVLIFSSICYFMIGFQTGAEKFFFFVLNLFLTTMAASALGFMFSATVRVFAIANLLIALCYVFMMVFSGLLVNLDSILSWLRWIKWFSIFRYSLDALSINELKDMTFCVNVNGTAPSLWRDMSCVRVVNLLITIHFTWLLYISDPNAGNEYLESQGISYKTTWDLWQSEVALGCMAVILLGFTYIQLRRIKKYT